MKYFISLAKSSSYQASALSDGRAKPFSPLLRVISLVLLSWASLSNLSHAQGADDKSGELKLPGSTRGLGDYIVNTVWTLEGGGIFRFRGDGTMVMPWHDFQWKPTGKRTIQMFTRDWRWEINFSDDMSSLEVPNRYKGKLARRLMSPLDDKKLEEILTTSSWIRASKSEKEGLTFAKNGKIIDPAKIWKSWELHRGNLIVKGVRDDKALRDEYFLMENKQPYVLVSPEGGDRPTLEQQ